MDFFQSIVNFFELIWELITGFCNGFITMIAMVGTASQLPVHIASFLPSLMAASVMSVMGIGVIKLILGR